MSNEVRSGETGAMPRGWEFLNASHPLFPVIFPKTAAKAASDNCSPSMAMEGALEELRSKIRRFLLAGIATSDVVEHIVGEVIVRMGMEQPLSHVDPNRGNGAGLFYTFLKRRATKEVIRLQRKVPTISISESEALISAHERESDGTTPQNRDLLEMVNTWLSTIPDKHAAAVRKWLDVENGSSKSLTPNDRVHRTRAIAALRDIARAKGLIE